MVSVRLPLWMVLGSYTFSTDVITPARTPYLPPLSRLLRRAREYFDSILLLYYGTAEVGELCLTVWKMKKHCLQ